MKDTILSIVRHTLTAAGGGLVAKGLLTTPGLDTLAGALVTLIGALWGAYDEWKAAHKNSIS